MGRLRSSSPNSLMLAPSAGPGPQADRTAETWGACAVVPRTPSCSSLLGPESRGGGAAEHGVRSPIFVFRTNLGATPPCVPHAHVRGSAGDLTGGDKHQRELDGCLRPRVAPADRRRPSRGGTAV